MGDPAHLLCPFSSCFPSPMSEIFSTKLETSRMPDSFRGTSSPPSSSPSPRPTPFGTVLPDFRPNPGPFRSLAASNIL